MTALVAVCGSVTIVLLLPVVETGFFGIGTRRSHFMKLLRMCCLILPLFALTASADILGSADAFGVLGASAVTNTGPSVVFQDLGVAPGTSITGFPPGMVLGTIHDDDAVAMQAQADALTGYNFLAGLARTGTLTGQNLGGLRSEEDKSELQA